jgi:hypothetical protein
MLLAMADRRLGIAERLARCFPDRRDPLRITHTLADMVRARILAIACGYEDADDLDALRVDPAFKLACGRLPDTGANLCSQPTLSRLENAPSLKDAIRLTWALVDQWMASYEREPASVILDIDDTCDVVHGHQQLSLFNAHYDERCFLPIHVYDTERRGPALALASRRGRAAPRQDPVGCRGARPSAPARAPYPPTLDPDAHHLSRRRPLCPARGDGMVRGQPHRLRLRAARFEAAVEENRRGGGCGATERALSNKPVVRGYAETRHKAKSWSRERRAVARIEATPLGLDTRFVVTNVEYGAAEWIYNAFYCARGQAENLIKLHKTQLASDRTSCRSATANQVRLVLHTAAYWLMLTVRDAIPKPRDLARPSSSLQRVRKSIGRQTVKKPNEPLRPQGPKAANARNRRSS